jgi:quercetin dioxygenase-like cupin family protein
MTFLDAYWRFSDTRGQTLGVINSGLWEEINYVETAAGCTRGGHYHRDTRELFLMIRGTVKVRIRPVGRSEVQEHTLSEGSIFVVEPEEAHWFETLTPCAWINVLSKRIDQAAPDIVPVAA